MVPTRRFWILAAIALPIAAFGVLVRVPILGWVYDGLLLGVTFLTSRMAPSIASLSVRRRRDPALSVRTENRVQVILENDGAEAISGRFRDETPAFFEVSRQEFPFSLAPGARAEFEYTVKPPRRGASKFRGTFFRLDCPLGLVFRQVFVDSVEPVRVYPNLLALKEFDLLKQAGRLQELGIRRSRFRGLGQDFESLREYTVGDDYRKLDWKATARRGKLVVRQFEQERNQSVLIVIDVGRHMLAEANGVSKLDHVLDALLMLTNAAAVAGDMVGLLVYADEVRRYIPPRKGRAQIGSIIDAIHDLHAEPLESDPGAAYAYLAGRWKRRSLLVAFTDYDDPERAQFLASAFAPMARRHIALLCRVLDPRLKETLTAPIESVPDLYRYSAANLLMEDRRAASKVLSQSGLHTLDSEPSELATDLVNYYFRMKELSLL